MSHRELFKQAMIDAMSDTYDAELADCSSEPINCSKSHYIKMEKILGLKLIKRERRFWRRTVAAILIAITLQLSSCSIINYRNEIGGFVENIYEEYLILLPNNKDIEAPLTIGDVYGLTYIPDGYVLADTCIRKTSINYTYKNNKDEQINFKQTILYTEISFDNERGETKIVELGGKKIYCRYYEESIFYIWFSNEYFFQIHLNTQMHENEINEIVKNIVVKNGG